MGWVLRLVEVDGSSRSVDVMAIDRPDEIDDEEAAMARALPSTAEQGMNA